MSSWILQKYIGVVAIISRKAFMQKNIITFSIYKNLVYTKFSIYKIFITFNIYVYIDCPRTTQDFFFYFSISRLTMVSKTWFRYLEQIFPVWLLQYSSAYFHYTSFYIKFEILIYLVAKFSFGFVIWLRNFIRFDYIEQIGVLLKYP